MKLNILLLLILLNSCNGQNTSQAIKSNENDQLFSPTSGEIVTELGTNIMQVYQDKQNIY